MEKNIFIFDQNKCVGCHACVVACMNENGFQTPQQWRNVHKSQDLHYPQLPLFYLSLACNHCDDAPCLKNCPALAYSRDKQTGAVIHHPEKCMGCKYCTWACPYDAPKYNPKQGIIEKCTFCNHRIEEGLKPACANLCPVGALDFATEDFTREESAVSSPVHVNVGSNIKIHKPRKKTGPEMDTTLFSGQTAQAVEENNLSKITAAEEWPLLTFTLLVSALVSLYASGLTDGFSLMQKHLYIAFASVAAIFSTLHLGKKLRAWRSVFNLKNSWLSKEIALFILFFAGVLCDFYIVNLPNIWVTGIGLLLLFAIDMLYKIATWQWPLKIHSAQTIFIAMTLFAFFSGQQQLFFVLVAFRIILYVYRNVKQKHKNIFTIPVLLVASAWLLYREFPFYYPLIVLAMAEIAGRIQFYNELNVPDPAVEFAASE